MPCKHCGVLPDRNCLRLIVPLVLQVTAICLIDATSASAQEGWFVNALSDVRYNSIEFVNDSVGFVSGYGVLMRTTDGGRTWENILPEYLFGSDQIQVAAVSADTVWALSTPSSTMRWTTDGGETVPWPTKVIGRDYRGFPWVTSFALTDTRAVIAVGQVGADPAYGGHDRELILRTTDGEDWYEIPPHGDPNFLAWDICVTKDNVIWVIGGDHMVMKSVDDGLTWEAMDPPGGGLDNLLEHISFLKDGVHGWISSSIFIYRTRDSGASWERVADLREILGGDYYFWEPIYDLEFVTEESGWAIYEHFMLHTTDGGDTWTKTDIRPLIGANGLKDLWFSDPDHGWAVGGDGKYPTEGKPSSSGFILQINRASTVASSIEEPQFTTPVSVYPNPLSTSAEIEFSLDSPQPASIDVYDLLGRRIERLDSGMRLEGLHRVRWNRGELGAGVYLIRVTTKKTTYVARAVVVD